MKRVGENKFLRARDDTADRIDLANEAKAWEVWKVHKWQGRCSGGYCPLPDGTVVFESKAFNNCYMVGKQESGPEANSEKVVLDCDEGDIRDFGDSKKWNIFQNGDGSYSFRKLDGIEYLRGQHYLDRVMTMDAIGAEERWSISNVAPL